MTGAAHDAARQRAGGSRRRGHVRATREFVGACRATSRSSPIPRTRAASELLNTRDPAAAFVGLGLLPAPVALARRNWDFAKLGTERRRAASAAAEAQRFDSSKVAAIVASAAAAGARWARASCSPSRCCSSRTRTSSRPSSTPMPSRRSRASPPPTAARVITVEGHSDPMAYLRAQEGRRVAGGAGAHAAVGQEPEPLARGRACATASIAFAKAQGIALDPSQFAVVGHGIAQPKSGMCGEDPCAPKNEQEWRATCASSSASSRSKPKPRRSSRSEARAE